MNTSPFPVQRSLLSVSALAEWVSANYNLPGSLTCQFWRRGINDLYVVRAKGIELVLRISPTDWRAFEHLAAEMDLLSFLHRRRICVPEPIRHTDGTCIQTLNAPEGPRYAVLFTYVPGVPPGPTEASGYRFGQAIARLHTVTDGYPADCAGFRFEAGDMVDSPLARLRPLFVEHPDDWDYLQAIAGGLRQAANRLPHTAPAYGICHGDVNDSNFHVIDEKKMGAARF